MIAHVLTRVVGLWLVLGPVYQGVSVTAMRAGGVASESKRLTATLTEVNGLGVLLLLLLLLAPVVLTALALIATLLTSVASAKRRVFLWISAILLLGFCAAGILSIGLFYLPAALALVVAAALCPRHRGQGQRRSGTLRQTEP